MYAIDISNPASPVVTDSIIANTRRVNDIMTTPDGKFLVFTREGATDRKNGIVICSLEDPAHPKPISEFTEGVTAGVHSTFIYKQEKFGTHIYLTNDGTGALHVIDIDDPVQATRGRAVEDHRARRGSIAARHRPARRTAVRELLERRTRDPRRRQRHQGRIAVQPAARVAVQVRPERSLSAGGGDWWAGLHSRHAHRVASQELRVHRGRGVPR